MLVTVKIHSFMHGDWSWKCCFHSATDDFNHGVVLSSRPLRSNEVFQVRIDKMVDKWAGSIEIGVTTHNPAYLQLPSTMTNLRSGKIQNTWDTWYTLNDVKVLLVLYRYIYILIIFYRDVDDDGEWCNAQWNNNPGRVRTQSWPAQGEWHFLDFTAHSRPFCLFILP